MGIKIIKDIGVMAKKKLQKLQKIKELKMQIRKHLKKIHNIITILKIQYNMKVILMIMNIMEKVFFIMKVGKKNMKDIGLMVKKTVKQNMEKNIMIMRIIL
jgi:hypothetical protein